MIRLSAMTAGIRGPSCDADAARSTTIAVNSVTASRPSRTQAFGRALSTLGWNADHRSPGSTHDLTAARVHDLIRRAHADIQLLADKGYQGAGAALD